MIDDCTKWNNNRSTQPLHYVISNLHLCGTKDARNPYANFLQSHSSIGHRNKWKSATAGQKIALNKSIASVIIFFWASRWEFAPVCSLMADENQRKSRAIFHSTTHCNIILYWKPPSRCINSRCPKRMTQKSDSHWGLVYRIIFPSLKDFKIIIKANTRQLGKIEPFCS